MNDDCQPCPFCWAVQSDLSPEEISPGVWAVCCTECGAQGPSNRLVDIHSGGTAPLTNREEAVKEWNTRA